ncbi:MAG: 3-deoxy-manno-octulosonate cytidylyltransferase [Gammaproteobacteria bacterium]|nr:3-deoxy-manno-octulosonate cytidylyltransferase [Gammaproteobacteria bacterium]
MNETKGFTVVIPARFGSTRLPGKPLIDLNGKPMIQRVVERALASQASRVIVATDSSRIVAALEDSGIDVVLTSPEHASGTDRIAEAVAQLDLTEEDVVVNVQGDEPLIPPVVIDQAAELVMSDPNFGVATLYEPMQEIEDVFNPNIVKVVVSVGNRAMYFSRAPIPWERGRFDDHRVTGSAQQWKRHIGIYAFKLWALARFVALPPSRLEKLESLEQLRLLESNVAIAIDESRTAIPAGVDTQADVDRVRMHLHDDSNHLA